MEKKTCDTVLDSCRHWRSRALSLPVLGDDAGWTSLFDGKTLDGWSVHGGFASYKAEDGTIVGTTVEGSSNTFLCKGDYKDFVLEVEVLCDPKLNSGIQVRSHVYEKDGPDSLDPGKHRTKGDRKIQAIAAWGKSATW